MRLTPGQGGLLDESFDLVTAAVFSPAVRETPLELAKTSRLPVVEALWHHWVLSSYFIERWVPFSSWPNEVQASARPDPPKSRQGRPTATANFNEDAMRAWRGRLAVRAALGDPDRIDAPTGRKPPPPISRPRRLDRLPKHLATLRDLVSTESIFRALTSSFGEDLVNRVVAGSSIATLDAEKLWPAIRAQLDPLLGFSGPMHDLVVTATTTGAPFRLHVDVRKAATPVLGDDLPFAVSDGTLPAKFDALFKQVDRLEAALVWARHSVQSSSFSVPPDVSLLPWGLAMTAVVRAYLVELLAAMTLASIPIPLLYWAPKTLTRATITIPGWSGRAKSIYAAYTAVALWEAWIGEPAPHVDSAVIFRAGKGYLRREGEQNLEVLQAIADQGAELFGTFWSKNAPAFHRDLLPLLREWRSRVGDVPQEIPEPAATPSSSRKPKAKGTPKDAKPATKGKSGEAQAIDDAFATAGTLAPRAWVEIPSLKFPPRRNQKPEEAEEAFKTTWHRCAHLHVQVALFATQSMVELFAEAAGLKLARRWLRKEHGELVVKDRAPDSHRLPIGDGSPRWGGNHAPHLEHRDGATFDIYHPFDFVPWSNGRDKKKIALDPDAPVPENPLGAFSNLSQLTLGRPGAVYDQYYIEHLFDKPDPPGPRAVSSKGPRRPAREATKDWLRLPKGALSRAQVDAVVTALWGAPARYRRNLWMSPWHENAAYLPP
jgi:hypothetical protein